MSAFYCCVCVSVRKSLLKNIQTFELESNGSYYCVNFIFRKYQKLIIATVFQGPTMSQGFYTCCLI